MSDVEGDGVAKGDAPPPATGFCDRMCGLETWKLWSAGKGDISGFFQLFFDNVATTLTLTFLLSPAGLGLLQEKEIYNGFLPGLGITMVFGNLYYSWMAVRLDRSEGRTDVTANPYGINTPGAFAYLFGVLLPVAFSLTCPEDVAGDEAQCAQWKSEQTLRVGVSANFVQGLIAALLGFVGPYIAMVCPVASLTSALGGIGISYLGIAQILYAFEQPITGMVPLFLMIVIYFGGLRTGYVPEALVIAGIGTILGWADGVATPQGVQDSLDQIGWHPPSFTLVSIFQEFPALAPYIGTILPVAITAAANTLMCWRTATKNGDKFPLTETMVVDGLGTCIASIFGCPFGTSVYIGHTAYKNVGAKSGYSVFNAFSFLILCLFGLFKLVQAIIPIHAVAPIILFVGVVITADAFESVPFKHIPAVVVGLMPSIADWSLAQCSPAPTDGNGQCYNDAPGNAGLTAFSLGSLLVAMILSAMFANIVDRKYLQTAIWAVIGSFFSLFGVIHSPSASIDFNNGTPQSQWAFCVGYLMVGATVAIIWGFQRFTSLVEDPVCDEMQALSVYELVHQAYAGRKDGTNVVEDRVGSRPKSGADMMRPPELDGDAYKVAIGE
mmetsp:Transcript_9261/g.26493  ORF Transcript_9261/g.26493 Transcript_9261/m.26493 type:complete len:610 (+) Transcript_9261:128-1957(+)|eukprot:CAMPEP_0117668836 /NCGR_PEP_ID=MMETSP0804-20121206/11779_1 /TAXON_ID=1074897 /ORGANISM="Tetraselmis astigmatica, Strain CCMP880" /LENGTH=609 /DNA_ID=CAMNT_0005476789 /DNA_START=110 /DNA_END=1939 /DNA_ORIENTATION=+